MRPLNYEILKYFTRVEKGCANDVYKALENDYKNHKAFRKDLIIEALMTAKENGLDVYKRQKWGSLVETTIKEEKAGKKVVLYDDKKAKKLREIEINESERIHSAYEEFDRAVGGGLVRDSVSILTARPGAGKSTLLLQLSKSYADEGLKVLYVSGEESESQIKSRSQRIMKDEPKNLWILSTNSMDLAIKEIRATGADIVILDSIQTFSLQEFDNKQGSPTQTIEVAGKAVDCLLYTSRCV